MSCAAEIYLFFKLNGAEQELYSGLFFNFCNSDLAQTN